MIPQDEYNTSQDNTTTHSDIFNLSPREETTPIDSESAERSEDNTQHATEVEQIPRKPRITGDRSLWFLYFAFLATSLLFIYSATSTLAYRGESLYAPFTGSSQAYHRIGDCCVDLLTNEPLLDTLRSYLGLHLVTCCRHRNSTLRYRDQ